MDQSDAIAGVSHGDNPGTSGTQAPLLASLQPIPKKNQGKGTYSATPQMWDYFEEMRGQSYMTDKEKEEAGLFDLAFADDTKYTTNKVPSLGIIL